VILSAAYALLYRRIIFGPLRRELPVDLDLAPTASSRPLVILNLSSVSSRA
jgi:hypothetical protein